MQKIFGKIEKGFMADMILLNENPLTEITNTRRIHAVIKSGIYFNRSGLDNLLKEAEKKASQGRFKPVQN